MDSSFYEKALPDSEETVMLALWDCEGYASFYQLDQALAGQRWAPSTLLNFLYRLQKRGYLAVEKQGGRNRYRALASRRDYMTARARDFLDKFCGGSLTALTRTLIEGRAISDEEMESLHQYLEQKLAALYSGSDLYDPWEG